MASLQAGQESSAALSRRPPDGIQLQQCVSCFSPGGSHQQVQQQGHGARPVLACLAEEQGAAALLCLCTRGAAARAHELELAPVPRAIASSVAIGARRIAWTALKPAAARRETRLPCLERDELESLAQLWSGAREDEAVEALQSPPGVQRESTLVIRARETETPAAAV